MLTTGHIEDFSEKGFFIIENAFSNADILQIRERIEDIVKGNHFKAGRRFQADTDTGTYGDVNMKEMNYLGPNISYRKIAELEYDDLILSKLQQDWVSEVCAQFVGNGVSIMRTTMMDKPAHAGTPLPWHQDLSIDWPVSSAPLLTMWFPLDEATQESGSLQVIPGSHKNGVIGRGHMLEVARENEFAPDDKILNVEMMPGDCLFFHPGVLHRSGINNTSFPRRAINIILMSGNTIHTIKKRPYPILFGSDQLKPDYVACLDKIPD